MAFKYYGTRPQDRTESSYWYAGAQAAAQEYALVGNSAKAAQLTGVADGIKNAILNNLWASGPVTNTPTGNPSDGVATGPRAAPAVLRGAASDMPNSIRPCLPGQRSPGAPDAPGSTG